MTRWGVVIDLRKCMGCEACVTTCMHTNSVPRNRWRQVIDTGIGGPPERLRTFVPKSCVHCGEPPCLEVCPTMATYRRSDGIVAVNYELCIGCGYCVVACPFLARAIILRNKDGFTTGSIAHEASAAPDVDDVIGVCSKCDFCLPRVETGLAQGLQPGLDEEATPACVLTCSAKALYFGDLDDSNSEVSRLIRENEVSRLQEELETDPAVYYITA